MYGTPQGGAGRDHAAGHQPTTPASLLFTPAHRAGGPDGGGRPSHLGRSPSGTPGYGAGAGGRAGGYAGREATPPSRRRSLTPGGGAARETPPPPPPADSLLDLPGGGGADAAPAASLGGWAYGGGRGGTPESGGVEDMQVSTSPAGGAPGGAAGARREPAAPPRAPAEYDDVWVTAFGFGASDVPLVLRELGRCGDIVAFGAWGGPPGANWLHLRYANRYCAQRALMRSGDQLSPSCMVGVKPVDPGHRAAIEAAAREAGGGGAGGPGQAAPLPRPAAAARVRAVGVAAEAAGVVPLPQRSAMAKVYEFVFGL